MTPNQAQLHLIHDHCRRKYCLDMGAFAFDALLLQQIEGPPWNYSGHGGESEFVDKLIPGGQPEDLQPLGNCGLNVYVFHNEYRTMPLVRQSTTPSSHNYKIISSPRTRHKPLHIAPTEALSLLIKALLPTFLMQY